MDLLLVEVNIVPQEGEQLASPHAGEHGAEPQRPPWLRRRLEEAANLLRREHRHLPLLAARPLYVLSWVGVEIPPLNGVLAHRLEDAEHVADRLGRELLGDQRLHELTHQGHIDLAKHSRSKERPNVCGEHAFARGQRRGLHAPELTLHREKILLPLLLKRGETDRRLREPELAIAALPHALGQHLLSLPLVRPDRLPPSPAPGVVIHHHVLPSPFPDDPHVTASFLSEAMPEPSDLLGHDKHETSQYWRCQAMSTRPSAAWTAASRHAAPRVLGGSTPQHPVRCAPGAPSP